MTISFKNCRIFDGINIVTDANCVVVEGARIVQIGSSRDLPSDGEVIDGTGMTLMPGLIDAHVHVYCYEANLSRNDHASMVARVLHAEQFMKGALNRGFTSLRDAGGADHELSAALNNRMFNGPRLFYSGLAISQTGGHGDMRVPEIRLCGCGYTGAVTLLADGADEVRKAAREQLRWGASQIKIMASGGAGSPSDPIWMMQYTEAEISAAVEEAARWRKYVMAHVYLPDAIARCAKLGVRSMEHCNHIDAESAMLVAAHDAFVVPTLATYKALLESGARLGWDEPRLEKIRDVEAAGLRSLNVCKAAGVRMGFGTDLLGKMHVHQCYEFEIRSRVLEPIEILRSATSINADILQKKGELGSVSVGAIADLVLVRGDPTSDLSVFTEDGTNVPFVLLNGEVVKNEIPHE